MRPTGRLHLGNYHGALKNWIRLQHDYECFFFVADWHALTTDYEEPSRIEANVTDMVIDWLVAGINPSFSTLFVQSLVPEHAGGLGLDESLARAEDDALVPFGVLVFSFLLCHGVSLVGREREN